MEQVGQRCAFNNFHNGRIVAGRALHSADKAKRLNLDPIPRHVAAQQELKQRYRQDISPA
jgi:hypothetical protein